ncbi:MAG: phosphoribosyltransferase family protein [Patescibacteria group bacterium]
MEFHTVTWRDLHFLSLSLAKKISASSSKPTLVVAIARGGLTIAQTLSDLLSLPVATFTISSYKNLKKTKTINLTYEVGGQLKEKHVLLVDDISDSGKTFIRGIKHLNEMGASSVQTASVFVKPWTTHRPDFWGRDTDKWVVFPYEVRETIESVATHMKKQGKDNQEIYIKLRELKISKQFIDRYFTAI